MTKLNGKETPDKYIISADYYDISKAGFFSDFGFFNFDYETHITANLFDQSFNYSSWSLAPENFPGEQNCK